MTNPRRPMHPDQHRHVPLLQAVILGVVVAVGLSVWLLGKGQPAQPSKLFRAPVARVALADLPGVAASYLGAPNIPVPPPPPPPPPPAPTPTPVLPTALLPVISRVPTDQPVIFITIDDGVYRSPEAAQYITSRGLPISAFLTTNSIGSDPGYFARLQQRGASIANHTIAHPNMTKLNFAQQKHEICASSDQLQHWYGGRPTLFRPPYGEYNELTKQAAADCGIKWLVMWNVVVDRGTISYQNPAGLQPGDIVLLHFRPELKQDLEALAAAAAARGLQFAQLADYLQ